MSGKWTMSPSEQLERFDKFQEVQRGRFISLIGGPHQKGWADDDRHELLTGAVNKLLDIPQAANPLGDFGDQQRLLDAANYLAMAWDKGAV